MWTKYETTLHVAVHVLSHGTVCGLQGPSEHLKYKKKNIKLVHDNKLDQKWLCLSLKPAAFGGPKNLF